jgi:hypothetical protein
MKGGSDSNLLYGLGGDDQLDGGAGSDGLHGGSGDDELTAVPVMTFYMILQEKILLTVALAMIKL